MQTISAIISLMFYILIVQR